MRKSWCLQSWKNLLVSSEFPCATDGFEFVPYGLMAKKNVLQNIADALVNRGETIALAESVTSGLLMVEMSLAKNATSFFQGGITAYNIGQKTRQLSVDP